MKKLITLLFVLIFSVNIFATKIYVLNETATETILGVGSLRPSYDSDYTILKAYVPPGQYSYFYTTTYNVYYRFGIVTDSGTTCETPSRYIGTTPQAIRYYYRGGTYYCSIQDYGY